MQIEVMISFVVVPSNVATEVIIEKKNATDGGVHGCRVVGSEPMMSEWRSKKGGEREGKCPMEDLSSKGGGSRRGMAWFVSSCALYLIHFQVSAPRASGESPHFTCTFTYAHISVSQCHFLLYLSATPLPFFSTSR
ncbi:hypothetical protein HKD37_15G042692 [Glycine soja]